VPLSPNRTAPAEPPLTTSNVPPEIAVASAKPPDWTNW
jgi:hypothetical protein